MDVTFKDIEEYLLRHKAELETQVGSYTSTSDYIRCRNHDLGEPATLPQAYAVFGKVWLDMTRITRKAGMPIIRWQERENSSYEDGAIFLYRGIPERDLPADLAHEYAHHLQGDDLTILSEGHARGIERMVSERFYNRHNHFGYLATAFERTEDELQCAWAYLFPEEAVPLRRFRGDPSERFKEYMLGTAAFCIAEDAYGEQVYRDVLHGNLSFLNM
jgi:hypothetical protein